MIKGFDILGGQWIWTGKLFSLILSAFVIAAFRLSPATVGLTFRQCHTSIGLIALAFLIGRGTCLGFVFKPGAPDIVILASSVIFGLWHGLNYSQVTSLNRS